MTIFPFLSQFAAFTKIKVVQKMTLPKKVEIIDHNITANPSGVKKITRKRAETASLDLGHFSNLKPHSANHVLYVEPDCGYIEHQLSSE